MSDSRAIPHGKPIPASESAPGAVDGVDSPAEIGDAPDPGDAPNIPGADAAGSLGEPPIHSDEVTAIEGAPIAVTPESNPATRSRFGPLKHRAFRNVWLGAFGSSVGGWMEQIGVQWVVAHESEQPMLAMSWLAAAHLAPTFVFGLHGGILADRVNRRTLLLVTQAILMVIATAIAIASATGHATPTVLIWLTLGYGVTVAFNVPAWQVLTPRLVPREELTEAIGLNGLQFNMARVIGPGIAGILLANYGATVLFVVNTVSFVGVLTAVAFTPDSPAPPRDGSSWWQQTKEALRFTFHERGPRAAFFAMVVFSFLAVPLLRMLPIFVKDVFHAEERAFGWLTAVMGLGAVVGVLLMRRVPAWYPKHHLIPVSVLGAGIAMSIFCSTESLAVGFAAMFVIGGFWLLTYNSTFSAMQLLVNDSMRGRVLAVCNVAVFGAMPLGSFVAGLIGEYASGRAEAGAGAQIGVGVLGVVLALSGLVMMIWRTPEVDGLRPGDAGYDRNPGLLSGLTAAGHRPAGPARSGR